MPKKVHFSILILLLFSFEKSAFSQTKKELILPIGHTSPVKKAQFSKNEKHILTFSDDETAKIWDPITGKINYTIFEKVSGAEFIGDGDSLLIIINNSDFCIYETKTAKLLLKVNAHENSTIKNFNVSSNHKYISTVGEEGSAKIWEIKTGKLITKVSQLDCNSTIISPDYSIFATTSYHKVSKIWDLKTGELLHTFQLKKVDMEEINLYNIQCQFSPDGKKIIITDYEGLAKIWDIETEKKLFTFDEIPFPKNGVPWSSWKSGLVSQTQFSRDGKYLYRASAEGIITKYDLENKLNQTIISVNGVYINHFELSKDEKQILISDNSKSCVLIDLVTNKIIKRLEHEYYVVNYADFNSNESKIITSANNNIGIIWDIKTGKEIFQLKGEAETIKSAKFNKTGNEILVSSGYNSIKVWKINSAEMKFSSTAHENSLTKAVYSPDGKYILSTGFDDKVLLSNEVNGEKILEIKDPGKEIFCAGISFDNTTIITGDNEGSVKIWNSENGKLIQTLKVSGKVIYVEFSSDNKTALVLCREFEGGLNASTILQTLDLKTSEIIFQKVSESDNIRQCRFYDHSKFIYINTYGGKLYIMDASTGEATLALEGIINNYANPEMTKFIVEQSDGRLQIAINDTLKKNCILEGIDPIADIDWTNEIFITLKNSKIRAYDFNGKQLYNLSIFNEEESTCALPSGEYISSKNINQFLKWKIEGSYYSFDQFDIKYNRPDIVIKSIGNADSSLISSYHSAYLKRLKKMNFTEDMLKDDFHLPEIKIANHNNIPVQTISPELTLDLILTDSKYKLDRINIFINDVPVYGTAGIDVRKENIQEIKHTINLSLSEGQNKIQVSVLNQAGAESYKETAYVTYKPQKSVQPDLYLVTIGDSKYSDSRYDLTYASKDATDIKNAFEKNSNSLYETVHTFNFTDEQVTKENILKLKSGLLKAKRDDVVIITVAGHGVLDKNLDYFLATYDMNFSTPSDKGLPYEELESLLDGIAPLKKVLFLDACHSGEVDKEEVELLATNTTTNSKVKFRNVGAGIQKKNLGLKTTSELMSELFTDLRRGTGATVISSAGGAEYAMESDEWKNGLFTYCLLHGLQDKAADENKDGQIMLSELQSYLRKEVTSLSNGAQQPTSRIENLSMDFRVW